MYHSRNDDGPASERVLRRRAVVGPGQASREPPRSLSLEAAEATGFGAPLGRGRGVGLGPPLRRMSTATVSASRPADRAGGVCPPGATFGFDDDAGAEDEADAAAEEDEELFGLIDTGLPGAGRRGVGDELDDEVDFRTVVVGASSGSAAPADGAGRAAAPFGALGLGFGADPGVGAGLPWPFCPPGAAGAGFGVPAAGPEGALGPDDAGPAAAF